MTHPMSDRLVAKVRRLADEAMAAGAEDLSQCLVILAMARACDVAHGTEEYTGAARSELATLLDVIAEFAGMDPDEPDDGPDPISQRN